MSVHIHSEAGRSQSTRSQNKDLKNTKKRGEAFLEGGEGQNLSTLWSLNVVYRREIVRRFRDPDSNIQVLSLFLDLSQPCFLLLCLELCPL